MDSVTVSVSLGYGTKNTIDENIQDILKIAEDHMYKNKLFESPSMRRKAINTLISTLHGRSKQEKDHAHKVSKLCRKMGELLHLPQGDIEELTTAGLLHDIGKIAITESILDKPGKLTADELEEIQRHPEIGYRILSTVNKMSQMAEYVLSHHERWDGQGYPKGLKGEAIPLQARIIHIVEAYNEMISPRTYRKTLSMKEVIAELQKNAGLQFDPKLIKLFLTKVLEHDADQ